MQQHGCSILARLADHLGSSPKVVLQRACSGWSRRSSDGGAGVSRGGVLGGVGAGVGGAGADAAAKAAGLCVDGIGYSYCFDGGALDERQAEEEIRRLKTLEVRGPAPASPRLASASPLPHAPRRAAHTPAALSLSQRNART